MELETVAQIEREGYFLRRFRLGEHSGTHMNAPAAFYPGGLTIEEYPAGSLIAPAVVVDMRAAAGANPDYALGIADIQEWESRHGTIPPGCITLLYTGWQAKWLQPDQYLGLDQQGIPHFPGFGLEAARFLLEARHGAGLGTDTSGLEPGGDTSFAVNRLALEQPRLALENLTNLDQLPPTGAVVVAGRLKLLGGSGSPVAVMALVPS